MSTNFVFQANSAFQDESRREEAYRKLLPELLALPARKVMQPNLDVPSVVAAVLGCLPRIQALRETASQLITFDVSAIDRLEDCALALSFAHSEWSTVALSTDDLADLNLEAAQTRDRFHADVSGLCFRNVIDPKCLKGYTRATGYKKVAADLLLLVTVMRSNWEKLEGRCPCEPHELDRAEKLATRMLRLVGQRDRAPTLAAGAADKRARAFTVLLDCYDSVRRAVVFLRWHHGDADVIAPSVYAVRKPRRRTVKRPEAAQAGWTAPQANPPTVRNDDEGNPIPQNPALPGGSPFMQ